jgi:hypothetical protein
VPCSLSTQTPPTGRPQPASSTGRRAHSFPAHVRASSSPSDKSRLAGSSPLCVRPARAAPHRRAIPLLARGSCLDQAIPTRQCRAQSRHVHSSSERLAKAIRANPSQVRPRLIDSPSPALLLVRASLRVSPCQLDQLSPAPPRTCQRHAAPCPPDKSTRPYPCPAELHSSRAEPCRLVALPPEFHPRRAGTVPGPADQPMPAVRLPGLADSPRTGLGHAPPHTTRPDASALVSAAGSSPADSPGFA